MVELTLNDQELVGLTPLGFSSQISAANSLHIKLGTPLSCTATENQLCCSSSKDEFTQLIEREKKEIPNQDVPLGQML